MPFTHSTNISYIAGGKSIVQAVALTAEGELNIEVPIASDAADLEIDVHIPSDEVKSFAMLSDQDLTIEYNDGAGAQGTFTLTANIPFFWFEGAAWSLVDILGYDAGAVDITKFFVTNDSAPAAAGTLQTYVLFDATP